MSKKKHVVIPEPKAAMAYDPAEKRFPIDFYGTEVMVKWNGTFPGTMLGVLKPEVLGLRIVAEGIGTVSIPFNKISYIDDSKLPITIVCGLEVYKWNS